MHSLNPSDNLSTGLPARIWVGEERRSEPRETQFLCDLARRVYERSQRAWPERQAVLMVGKHPCYLNALSKLEKVAGFDEPVLITGESGVGKELAARAVYLLSQRCGKPFVSVNCPQYQEGNLTVSELFGHEKGSFTGAVERRRGCFEEANAGLVFLDEIGDLHMNAQVMLLRALAEGEYQRIGSNRTQRMNVRVVACTNRSLNGMMKDETFRNDLFFRLRYFAVHIPPLRERGDDWQLLIRYFLDKLAARYRVVKTFSKSAMALLHKHSWPGNVRELHSIVTAGYAMADGPKIEIEHFVDMLETSARQQEAGNEVELLDQMLNGQSSFWEAVYEPFLDRELNREQVRRLVRLGLEQSNGCYRDLVPRLGIEHDGYQKFMDFLRHHRLKP